MIYRSPNNAYFVEPRQQPAENPMDMYRLPGSTLQTGFAYIDRAHIPFTNPALNMIDNIPDLTSITTQPGFAAAFNREINAIAIRNQLADFFNENKRNPGPYSHNGQNHLSE